jgi:hypothetical protein
MCMRLSLVYKFKEEKMAQMGQEAKHLIKFHYLNYWQTNYDFLCKVFIVELCNL